MSSRSNKKNSLNPTGLRQSLGLVLSLSLLLGSTVTPSLAVAGSPAASEAETTPQADPSSTAEQVEEKPKEEGKVKEETPPAEESSPKEESTTSETTTESPPNPETKTPETPAKDAESQGETPPQKDQSEAESTEGEATTESADTDSGGEADSGSEAEAEKEVKKPEHISEADNLLLEQKFDEAEEAYRALIEDDENGDAYAGLAVALAKQEDPKKVIEAERILYKCKDDYPDNPNMMAAAGFVAFKHSKNVASPAKRDRYLDASLSLCERAVEKNSSIVIALQTAGLVKMAQDEPEEAANFFKKAYMLAEDKENGTFFAQAKLKVNPKSSIAAKMVEKVLEMDPDYSPAKLQKAIVLTNSGKHEESFTELHSIPRPDRESEWYKVQGDIYQKQGDGNSAVSSWKESVRRNPRNPDPYKMLARYYMLRGDGEFAIAEMHSALEILPNDIKLRQNLAELALRLNKLEVAEQEFRTILNVKPDDPSALLGLARVFFRKARIEGQYPQGWIQLKDKLQEVIEQNNDYTSKVVVAELQDKIELAEAEKALTQKQFRDAARYFGKVIGNHKENPFQLLTLAEQAFNDGDLKSAELAYSYAREIPEVAPRAEQGISKITSQRKEAERQIKLGDATEKKLPDVAEDHYKQALIADPQLADAYYSLFFLYLKERKDKLEETIEYAENFLEASDDSDSRRQKVEKILFKLKDRLRKENSK